MATLPGGKRQMTDTLANRELHERNRERLRLPAIRRYQVGDRVRLVAPHDTTAFPSMKRVGTVTHVRENGLVDVSFDGTGVRDRWVLLSPVELSPER